VLPLLGLLLGLLAFDLYIFAARFIPSRFTRVPVAPLYVPVAVILAVLLVTPPRRWWLYLVAAYGFQVALFTGFGYPLGFNLVAEAPTVIEPLIAAYLLYRLDALRPRFTSVRELTAYAACVIAAAIVSAFLGAGLRASLGFAYWPAWLSWLLGDGLASLLLAPALVLWATAGAEDLRIPTRRRAVEVALWGGLVVLVGVVAQYALRAEIAAPALIYVPIPLLVWAAVRFGPRGLVSALAFFTVAAIVGVVRGTGPFAAAGTTSADVLSVQLFLAAIGTPLFFLAALVQERAAAERTLRASEDRYRAVVRTLPHSAVLLFDAGLRHSFADGPGLAVLGLTPAELEGRTVWKAFSRDLATVLAPHYDAALSGQVVEVDVEHAQHVFHVQVVPMPTAATASAAAPLSSGMVVLQDVTEQRRARDELERERTLTALLGALSHEFRTLAEHSPDSIARLDPSGRYVYVNQAAADAVGLTSDQLIGKSIAELGLDQHVYGLLAEALRDVVATCTSRTFMVDVQLPLGQVQGQGQVHSFQARFIPELDEGGTLVSVLAIATDVSALKQAQAHLAEQASQLEAIFEAKADGIGVFDRQRRLVQANSAWQAIHQRYAEAAGLGADPAFAALPLADQVDHLVLWDEQGHVIPRERRPTSRALRGETITGASAVDEWVHSPEGRAVVAFSVSAAPVRDRSGRIAGAVTIVREVTERRQLEARLAEQERQFRTLVEHSPDMITRFDPTLRHQYMSPRAAAVLGIPATQSLGKSYADLGLPEALYAPWERAIREVFATGTPHEMDVSCPYGGDPQINHYRVRLVPEFGPDESVESVLGITTDVTELRRTEARLAEQACQLEAIFEAQADGVGVYDPQGNFVRANTALRRLFGFAADGEYTARPLGERAERLQHFDERGRLLPAEQWPLWGVLRGEIVAGTSAMDIRVQTLDGRELWASITGAPIRTPDGQVTGAVLVTRDVTARRELERRLQAHAARAAAEAERARLAGELHDTVTQELYSASLLTETLPRVWERRPDEAKRAIGLVHEITRSGLATLRMLLLELQPDGLEGMALPTLLHQLLAAMRTRAGVPLVLEIEGEEDSLPSLPPEVKQALYRMAQEAVTNAVKYASASRIAVRLRRGRQGTLHMEIQDDGVGFDPRLSTPGHFGLTMMRERAHAVSATVRIESHAGQGTRVVIHWRGAGKGLE
jgi:PAS domain S-box-containing protein